MSAQDQTLGRRIRRLPGQLLLALINATAILVIVAAVLAILAIDRFETAGADLAADLTVKAVSQLGMTPEALKTKLASLEEKMETIRTDLAEAKQNDDGPLRTQIAELNDTLTNLKAAVVKIGDARPAVAEAAIKQIGATLTDMLLQLRNCGASGTEMSGSSADLQAG
ncbi:hypothetical protein [Roseibium aggregatum]|uniref:Uncharacterized protein n=1 Tax=Roseibium aggregatum TaxID=187304 RepID=A0A926NYK5_9HYPH|nr:hypothetical protein [Roseibium aggregatum]MBD1548749.1 hypothetical protein [Roseibium aggregatum]